MSVPGLDVLISRLGAVVVVRLVGEIDLANADATAVAVAERTGDAAAVVVDLTDVAYLDSSAMRALDGIVRAEPGRRVLLVAPPEGAAGAALRLIGFPGWLLAPSAVDAVAALAAAGGR